MSNKQVTQKELIRLISQDTKIPQTVVKPVLLSFVKQVSQILINDGHVNIINLGTFKTTIRKGREFYIAGSDTRQHISDRLVPKFLPSDKLRRQVKSSHPRKH